MSVGVCVINQNGLALATDSAATFTANKMFYNSVIEKICKTLQCGVDDILDFTPDDKNEVVISEN